MNNQGILRVYDHWLNWNFRAKIISTLFSVILCTIAALVIVNYNTNVNQTTEQVGAQLVTLGDQTIIRAAEKVGEETKLLQTLAKTPSIIAAVKQANLRRADWTPEMIALQDNAWTLEDPSIETTMQEIAGNPISAYLLDFQSINPEQVEVFITDQLGLNVAMTNQTSDFLQSDEEWWSSTFAEGLGSVFYGSVEYDDSARAYTMNIGVPIIDPLNNRAIGVLRGSLDISVMIHALGNIKVGTTGNVILLNAEGIVLYSQIPSHIMKPAPTELLSLLNAGQSGWEQSNDMDGNPSVVAYSFLQGEQAETLGWRLFITQHETEIGHSVLRSLLISVLVGLLVAGLGIFVSVFVMTNSIATPLTALTDMAQELSVGNIIRNERNVEKEGLHHRQDEIGAIGQAFDRLMDYFRAGADASAAIANKDLTVTITPNSEKDELGVAFAKMVEGLRQVIGQVAENAEAVSRAASQLAAASEQSGQATGQIALTIQQVALGISQQSQDAGRTSGSVEQMNYVIRDVSAGAQEQANLVRNASSVVAQISSLVRQVQANAQAGTAGARDASEVAINGSKTIEAAIAGMQSVKTKVGLSADKVREMGKNSEQIGAIVETIDEIASQTNMLALNAAIEAARVEARGEKTVETLLQQHMLGAAHLVAYMLATGNSLGSKELETLAQQAQLEDLCISDSDGVVVACSNPSNLGFRFSEDSHQQSSMFRSLLNRRDGVVIQPLQARDQDGKPYVYVGVSRRDQPGIVQTGISGDALFRLLGYSRGFAVVATEIRRLADHAKEATKEVAALIRTVQKTVSQAIAVMEDGVRDVENRSAQANEASQSLITIRRTVESVNRQVEEIAAAIGSMDASSKELVRAMEAVSAVVEENTTATEKMTVHAREMTQAVENIASVSEENSASVEEVSASTEEVSAQVEQVSASAASLMHMAQSLQQVVAEFKLNHAGITTPQLPSPSNVHDVITSSSPEKMLHAV